MTEYKDYPSDDNEAYDRHRQRLLDKDLFEAIREDFDLHVLTNGKGLPPDGLIEEWKHERS